MTEEIPRKRRRTPLLIAGLAVLALGSAGVVHVLNAGRESTDDAQVEGRVMNVSARVSGQVAHVLVSDNQAVEAGQVLVELDRADFQAKSAAARADVAAARAAADAARAALALTEKTAPANVVQAQGGITSAASLLLAARASITQADADIDAAASRSALAQLNLKRARQLFEQGAVAQAEVDQRQTEFDSAHSTLEQAQARKTAANAAAAGSAGGIQLARGRLSAADTSDEQVKAARAQAALADARVLQAESALELAELNLSYATVRAARRGVISRRNVEDGQMVSPDRPLFAIVPLDDVWVVANFKEDQLADMRRGQTALVRLDTYGGREFPAKIDSIAGGTGARFALLPPDNATGNFVKVVQRVPVLLRLDSVANVELRPGMSADVTVRTSTP